MLADTITIVIALAAFGVSVVAAHFAHQAVQQARASAEAGARSASVAEANLNVSFSVKRADGPEHPGLVRLGNTGSAEVWVHRIEASNIYYAPNGSDSVFRAHDENVELTAIHGLPEALPPGQGLLCSTGTAPANSHAQQGHLIVHWSLEEQGPRRTRRVNFNTRRLIV